MYVNYVRKPVPDAPSNAPDTCKNCSQRGGAGKYCRTERTHLWDARKTCGKPTTTTTTTTPSPALTPPTPSTPAPATPTPVPVVAPAPKPIPVPSNAPTACIACPERVGTTGGKCKLLNNHIWGANKDKGCPNYTKPKPQNFTQRADDPDPEHLPIKTMTLTKFGIRMKNKEFREAFDKDPDDETFRVMRTWDVYKFEERTKSYKVTAKFSTSPTNACRCCGRTLTNEISVLHGIGPICAGRVGVTAKDEREALKQLQKYADDLGFFTTFIPKGWVELLEEHPDAPNDPENPHTFDYGDFFDADWIPHPCGGCPLLNGSSCGRDNHDVRGFWLFKNRYWLPDGDTNCADFDTSLKTYQAARQTPIA